MKSTLSVRQASWWINTRMMGLLAQDDNLDPMELRVLIALMALHEDGPVTITQKDLAHWLGRERARINKALMGLIQFGYIHREGKTYRVDGSLMFCGRRGQRNKKIRIYLNRARSERSRNGWSTEIKDKDPEGSH